MSRPKLDPMIRYSDCAKMLNYVVDHQGPYEYECLTEPEAISMLQRLNQYRKIVRENNDGLTILDNFVFTRRGALLRIYSRPHIDPNRLRLSDGSSAATSFKMWEESERQRFLQRHGAFTTPQPPMGAPESNPHDPNPFAQDKPLKLDDD